MSAGTATAAANVSGHCPPKHRAQAVTTTAQRSESWAQHISPYYKEIGSLSDPISSRPSAAATVNGHRPPRPSAAATVSGHRPPKHRAQAVTMMAQRSESWAQHISPYYKEIGSLSDPISSRPSAAATVSGHRPPKHRAQAVTTTAQRSESWAQHISPYYKEIGSLSDPISPRPSAAATASRLSLVSRGFRGLLQR